MNYKPFKNGSEQISLLGLGCMRLPKTTPDGEEIDYPAAEALLDMAYQNGVNYFDTAYFYHGGGSESFVGHALAKYPRKSFYLATKMPMYLLEAAEDIPRIFDEQLARCKVDYFDFYLCHALSAEHFQKAKDYNLLPFLEQKKREGKIRHIGFSFHDTPDVLEEICAYYPWEFAQIQLNPLDWDIYKSRQQYEILERHGLPCIVMEPVRGGRLADLGDAANAKLKALNPAASIASWSVRFAAGLSNTLVVLSGMSNKEQLADNLATISNFAPLSKEEQAALDDALTTYRKSVTVGCTSCHYCLPCPVGVNIPGIFALFNEQSLHGGLAKFTEKYADFPEGEKAHNCIHCGHCNEVCPQHLTVWQLLEKLEAGASPC